MVKFTFKDAKNTATLTCCHVLEGSRDILYASHDEDDGMWQFLCGGLHQEDDARIISLREAFELDNSISELSNIPYGSYAERKSRQDKWSINKS